MTCKSEQCAHYDIYRDWLFSVGVRMPSPPGCDHCKRHYKDLFEPTIEEVARRNGIKVWKPDDEV